MSATPLHLGRILLVLGRSPAPGMLQGGAGEMIRTATPETADRSPVDCDAQPQVTANDRSYSDTIGSPAGAGERATTAPIRWLSQHA